MVYSKPERIPKRIEIKKRFFEYLTQDEKLVNNLDRTMINSEEGVEKLNENMETLRQNFTNTTVQFNGIPGPRQK